MNRTVAFSERRGQLHLDERVAVSRAGERTFKDALLLDAGTAHRQAERPTPSAGEKAQRTNEHYDRFV